MRLEFKVTPGAVRRMLSFAAIGGIATALQYAILILLVEVLSVTALVASSIGFACSAALNYWLNYHLTFRSSKPHSDSGPKFMMIAAVGLGINSGIVAIGTEVARVNYLVVQVVATAFVLAWNFLANSAWTFAKSRD
ncbi:MAG: GtrA family protein [Steroidobacteraceae bacterium]